MAADPTTGVDASLPTGQVTTNIPAVAAKSPSSSDAQPGGWNPPKTPDPQKASPVFDVAGTGNDGPGKGGARGGMEGPSSGPVGGVSGHEIY